MQHLTGIVRKMPRDTWPNVTEALSAFAATAGHTTSTSSAGTHPRNEADADPDTGGAAAAPAPRAPRRRRPSLAAGAAPRRSNRRFRQHLVGPRQQSVAVVDGDRYLGIACAEDFGSVDRDAWATTRARDIMRTDVPVADLDWTLADAIRAIDDAATDRIAVCDHGTFVRMITSADLVELDEVLDRTSRPPGGER